MVDRGQVSERDTVGGFGRLAVDKTVILLHPPLPLVGVSMRMERGCQQNDSLADGYGRQLGRVKPEGRGGGGLLFVLVKERSTKGSGSERSRQWKGQGKAVGKTVEGSRQGSGRVKERQWERQWKGRGKAVEKPCKAKKRQ